MTRGHLGTSRRCGQRFPALPSAGMEGAVGDAVAAKEGHRERRIGSGQAGVLVVLLVVIAAAALRPLLERLLGNDAVAHWATIFVAIAIQAMPFLVLGITVSAAVA